MSGLVLAAVILILAPFAGRGKWWRYAFHSAYALLVIYGGLAIPARTGFELEWPTCEMLPSLEGAGQALMKFPHIFLFGIFYIVTAIQFPRTVRYRLLWPILVTIAFGLVIEIEEGATRTGNCRMRDLLPDTLGALTGLGLVLTWNALASRRKDRDSLDEAK